MPANTDFALLSHQIKYTFAVQLRYSYRLYPTPGQQHALARAFGCARVVFNDGLSARQEAHAVGLPYVTDAELSVRLTAAKATPERAWLSDVSAVVLQQALADLNAAYRNFSPPSRASGKGRKSSRPGSGRARTADKPSGSPPTPGSRSCPAGSCACPRSATCPSAGHGNCRPPRPASP
jgi:transposase